MGWTKYLKQAFLFHWNLLAFGGGTAAALLSGHADVFLPLVVAAETTYLGLLATHPKFQSYVEAQEAKATRETSSQKTQRTLDAIIRGLPPEQLDRFHNLRRQCLELRQLSAAVQSPLRAPDQPLESLQEAGLDRLLWIHLRLLFSQHALSRFLQKTSESRIQADVASLQKRLNDIPENTDEPAKLRMRHTLQDNLETSLARLANVSKARETLEFVSAEIERLENKLRNLCETAVNRHEPEFISGQVDQVAASLTDTERTMNDLKFATGLETMDDEPPELIQDPPPIVIRN